MGKNGNDGKVVMREYDYDNTRDDEKARGYLPPGLRGAVGKDSPRPDEDNRLLSCFLMRPGIRINQDCADPCRDMSTQEPVGSIKVRRSAAASRLLSMGKSMERTNAHQDVTPETLTTDFHVRKNARFTHDMTNFGHDVRGKRFSTHGAREQIKKSTCGESQVLVFRSGSQD